MRSVLILCRNKPDWIIDYFYQGAISIGHHVDFYPEREFYSYDKSELKEESHSLLQPAVKPESIGFFRVWVKAAMKKYDIVVVHSVGYGYDKSLLSRASNFIKALVKKDLSWRYINLLPINSPIVVIDSIDDQYINERLLDSGLAKLYFKRELSRGVQYSYNSKIRTVRLGINASEFDRKVHIECVRNKYDICYVMNSSNHELRYRVKKRLESLSKEYRIFIHDSGVDGKISLSEYAGIVKSSKITISISGLGWDCLRHYEVPVIGSALFVNEPTIETGDFFENGKECIMFKNDLTDFLPKIEFYLSDDNKRSLDEIREAGRKAVEDRFDVSATAKYIIQSSIG